MKYAVITGVSKGLGESVAKLFIESGIAVIGISRSKNSKLPQLAEENHTTYTHYSCDISDTAALEETYYDMEKEIFSEEPSAVYLVNNAGVVEPVDQAANIDYKDLLRHVHVNTAAPMVLTNLFLKKATAEGVQLVGANVTSGAANRPTYGWSAYCSTKASIDMYTQTVALEQEELNTGNKIIAFSPGIMDTEMQNKLRSSTKEQFASVDTFKKYKENEMLSDPDSVGSVLVDILTDEGIKSGNIYDVKDYL
ncbi:(S)-benzoin forming benzil reductase [Lentibacillus sediminis]|uniref:(S)-benzoin forming benzil reductase n=1 Tax=Lentibacillus sediminis TaxID=1940529 RepID=UPI000C1C3514|nr:(S)-benzoin forming benzil reductase [Lentibacillus sediminis]